MHKLIRFISLLLVSVMMLGTMAFADTINEPSIFARSAVLYNPDKDVILYAKDMDAKIYPASMTKVLTALLVLEYFEPDELITVGTEINEVSLDSSKAGHIKGEVLNIETLVRGLIIPSGNDTAVVAACAVAKRYKNDTTLNYNQCMTVFSAMMNERAKELGCKNSNFSNPHGYHADDHYTTSHDMALIVAESIKNELISKIAMEKSYSGSGAGDSTVSSDTITQEYNWMSHNLLITSGEYYYQHATGLKTGFTDQAGSCVAATAEKEGTTLIAIVSDSEDPDRWYDAKALFEYGFNNFTNHTISTVGGTASSLKIANPKKNEPDTLDLITKESKINYLRNDKADGIISQVNILPEYIAESKDGDNSVLLLKAPIEKDTAVGTITYTTDDTVLFSTELYASRDVEKAGIIQRITETIKTVFSVIFSLKGLIVAVVVVIIIIIILLIRRKRSRSYNYYSGYRFKSNNRRFR
ncbi:MAG: D-alanyl-D-alanine carboxypeptidase [Lachnospiraceae bacterium]|nr:D-alanyl-D-alanine carboxypeptidase [Lachnospiraceae bacterium]